MYKTINGGTTLTNITGNLPAIPVWSLQIDSTANRLFVGADDGVYLTTNAGTTWSRFGTGPPAAQVVQLKLNTSLTILGARPPTPTVTVTYTGGTNRGFAFFAQASGDRLRADPQHGLRDGGQVLR